MQNPDGTPIWFELNTTDEATAKAFYAATIGWSIASFDMGENGTYNLVNAADGAGIAGIVASPPDQASLPGWAIYFGVGDVDAAAGRITSLGGSVVFGPMDIPDVGRFAIVGDPQGVLFMIMKGNSAEPSTAFLPGPGNFGHGVWIELATPDPDAAFTFYGALFGWTREGAMPMGPMGDYAFLGAGAARPGAVMSSVTTGAPARWNCYFLVPDIDAAIATVAAQGGTLIQGPDQIPGGDYSANITDPAGNHVGLVGSRKG